MRRLLILAVLLGLTGCGYKVGGPPKPLPRPDAQGRDDRPSKGG